MAEAATSGAPPLEELFNGGLAYCAGNLSWGGDPSGFLDASELLRPEVIGELLARFGALHPDADPRAVASLWAQWYFGTLLVPATAVLLQLRRTPPLHIHQVGVRIDPRQRHAVAFHLPDLGRFAPDADPFQRFHDLVRHHLAPLVDALARSAGISHRMLWSSAGGYAEWTVRQLETRPDGAAAAAAGDQLLTARRWPDGEPNPLFQPVRYLCDDGTRVRRRRVCCLRYLLPGVASCGSACPLPKVRAGGDGGG